VAAPPAIAVPAAGCALPAAIRPEHSPVGGGNAASVTFVTTAGVADYAAQLKFKLGGTAVNPNNAYAARLAGVAAIGTAPLTVGSAGGDYWNADRDRIIHQTVVANGALAAEYVDLVQQLVAKPVRVVGAKIGWGPAATQGDVDARNAERLVITTRQAAILVATGLNAQAITALAATDLDANRWLGNFYGTCAGSKLAFHRSMNALAYNGFGERMVGPDHAHGQYHTSCETCAAVIRPIIAI